MKKLVISLPLERPKRTEAAFRHFQEMGMDDVLLVQGIDAEKAGLRTVHPYEVDNPGSGFNMGPKPVGILLGHYIAWQICTFLDDDVFLIMEDDVQLHEDWQERMRCAFRDVPEGWDVLFLGSCDTGNQRQRRIAGDVWEVFYPQCMHCYAVRKKALGYMLATQRRIYGPIDCTLIFHTWPALKVYTLLPRLADQFNTEISL